MYPGDKSIAQILTDVDLISRADMAVNGRFFQSSNVENN